MAPAVEDFFEVILWASLAPFIFLALICLLSSLCACCRWMLERLALFRSHLMGRPHGYAHNNNNHNHDQGGLPTHHLQHQQGLPLASGWGLIGITTRDLPPGVLPSHLQPSLFSNQPVQVHALLEALRYMRADPLAVQGATTAAAAAAAAAVAAPTAAAAQQQGAANDSRHPSMMVAREQQQQPSNQQVVGVWRVVQPQAARLLRHCQQAPLYPPGTNMLATWADQRMLDLIHRQFHTPGDVDSPVAAFSWHQGVQRSVPPGLSPALLDDLPLLTHIEEVNESEGEGEVGQHLEDQGATISSSTAGRGAHMHTSHQHHYQEGSSSSSGGSNGAGERASGRSHHPQATQGAGAAGQAVGGAHDAGDLTAAYDPGDDLAPAGPVTEPGACPAQPTTQQHDGGHDMATPAAWPSQLTPSHTQAAATPILEPPHPAEQQQVATSSTMEPPHPTEQQQGATSSTMAPPHPTEQQQCATPAQEAPRPAPLVRQLGGQLDGVQGTERVQGPGPAQGTEHVPGPPQQPTTSGLIQQHHHHQQQQQQQEQHHHHHYQQQGGEEIEMQPWPSSLGPGGPERVHAWMQRVVGQTGTCSVCLEPLAPPTTTSTTTHTLPLLRVLPLCGHAFHAACLDPWLMHSATCPLCRKAALPLWVLEVLIAQEEAHQQDNTVQGRASTWL